MDDLIQDYLLTNQKDQKKPGEIPAYVMPQIRYQWIQKILEDVQPKQIQSSDKFVKKIDALLTNSYSGAFVFTGVMYLIFQLLYTWSEPIMSLIESLFGYLTIASKEFLVGYPVLSSLVGDGILQGVGSVIVFLPSNCLSFFVYCHFGRQRVYHQSSFSYGPYFCMERS